MKIDNVNNFIKAYNYQNNLSYQHIQKIFNTEEEHDYLCNDSFKYILSLGKNLNEFIYLFQDNKNYFNENIILNGILIKLSSYLTENKHNIEKIQISLAVSKLINHEILLNDSISYQLGFILGQNIGLGLESNYLYLNVINKQKNMERFQDGFEAFLSGEVNSLVDDNKFYQLFYEENYQLEDIEYLINLSKQLPNKKTEISHIYNGNINVLFALKGLFKANESFDRYYDYYRFRMNNPIYNIQDQNIEQLKEIEQSYFYENKKLKSEKSKYLRILNEMKKLLPKDIDIFNETKVKKEIKIKLLQEEKLTVFANKKSVINNLKNLL